LIVRIHPADKRRLEWLPDAINIPPQMESNFQTGAMKNHGQTVERLNERGGMSSIEIYMAWKRLPWRQAITRKMYLRALMLVCQLASDGKR
jgi:hypothetical protein